MNTTMRIFNLLALATLLTTSAIAQEAELKDLTIEQASVAHVRPLRPGSMRVSLMIDHADATYAIGDTVKFLLTSNEDAYVIVLDVGPTGRVTQLFPNRYQTDNRVFANRAIEIGGGSSGAKVTVAGPVGVELVKVIASRRPIAFVSDVRLQGEGPFRIIDGGVHALLRDLEVVADHQAKDDARIAVLNVVLRTVPDRGAPGLTIVPGRSSMLPGAAAPWAVAMPSPVETDTVEPEEFTSNPVR
jgi:hypothetical protein